jgi:hypothetical protein
MLRKISKQGRFHARCYIPEEGYYQASICQSSASLQNVAIPFLIFGVIAKLKNATNN